MHIKSSTKHMSEEQWSSEAISLLDLIFDERPARCRNYAVNTIFELRRSTNQTSLISATSMPSTAKIPHWLESSSFTLGPYERNLLHSIINASDAFTLIQGGTGSGKSTILQFIMEHIDQAVERAPWVVQPLPDEKWWLSIRRPLLVLPVDSRRDDVQEQVQNPGKIADKAFLDIKDGLKSGLKDVIPNENNYRDVVPILFREFLWPEENNWDRQPMMQQKFNGISTKLIQKVGFEPIEWTPLGFSYKQKVYDDSGKRLTVMEALKRKFSFLKNRRLRAQELYNKIDEAIDALEPADQVNAWLFPYASLSTTLQRHEFPMTIAIDNIDQYEPVVQKKIYTTLVGMIEGTRLERIGLRFLVFLRMSSSMNIIGAFPSRNPLPHKCPVPSEVILLKVAMFFTNREDLKAYKSMSEVSQSMIDEAFVELLLQLVHPKSVFANTLSSISGTNLRITNTIIKQWMIGFQSEREVESQAKKDEKVDASDYPGFEVVRKYASSHPIGDEGKKIFFDVFTPYFIWAISERIGLGWNAYVNKEDLTNIQDDSEIIDRIVDCFIGATADALSEARIFHMHNEKTAIRCMFGASVGEYLINNFDHKEGKVEQIENYLYGMVVPVSHFFIDLQFKYPDISSVVIIGKIRNKLQTILMARLELGKSDHPRIPLLKTISKGIINALDRCLSEQMATVEIHRELRGQEFYRKMYKDNAKETIPMPIMNTNDAVRNLLELDTEDDGHVAVNVFVDSEGHFKPIPLRIIYALGLAKKNSLQWKDIDKIFALMTKTNNGFSYKPKDILNALLHLVHPKRRLLYSGVSDYETKAEEIVTNTSKSVCNSWAGQSYFENLIHQTYYIGWCSDSLEFDSRGVAQEQDSRGSRVGVVKEFVRVLDMFSKESKYEMEAFPHDYMIEDDSVINGWSKDSTFRVLFPVTDIFFRSANIYLKIIAANYYGGGSYSGKSSRSQALKGLANHWYKTAEKIIHNSRKDFDYVPQLWEEEFLWLIYDFDDMLDL